MKVLHVTYADIAGGAGIAAYRLHRALLNEGLESRMEVVRKHSSDPTVFVSLGRWGALRALTARELAKCVLKLENRPGPEVRSLGFFSSGVAKSINRSDADIVHLHWVGNEMLTVPEIGGIRKPLVWTMHDMWAVCGTEHYDNALSPGRFQVGYSRSNRTAKARGLDLDRWAFHRKQKHWQGLPVHVVCPSAWMGECIAGSSLLGAAHCSVIPNAIDTDAFKPCDRHGARAALGLPIEKRLILFGAQFGLADHRKGFDLLIAALDRLAATLEPCDEVELVVFGGRSPGQEPDQIGGFPVRYVGPVQGSDELAKLYSSVDVFVAPSRQDNLPNTLVEAQACGTPCVAFDVGGISDIVVDGVTGILAPPEDADALAEGIARILKRGRDEFADRARSHTLERFASPGVARRHIALYRDLLQSQHSPVRTPERRPDLEGVPAVAARASGAFAGVAR